MIVIDQKTKARVTMPSGAEVQILGLLFHLGAMRGRDFNERVSFPRGTLYTTLGRMRVKRLVKTLLVVEGSRRLKAYRITEAGQRLYHAWWELQKLARKQLRPGKLRLEPGKFYKSRSADVWCCYRVGDAMPCLAHCIRTRDDRREYFYLDGRYDIDGLSAHCLVTEVLPPREDPH